MQKYSVTMWRIVDGKPSFYTVNICCKDAATEIYLNPEFKNIYEVKEINAIKKIYQ